MIFVIGLGLIFATALTVCIPLFRTVDADGPPEAVDDPDVRWENQKHDAYSAIREAELDLRMGKLSRADYDAIRATQEARAVEALRALEHGARGKRQANDECGSPMHHEKG